MARKGMFVLIIVLLKVWNTAEARSSFLFSAWIAESKEKKAVAPPTVLPSIETSDDEEGSEMIVADEFTSGHLDLNVGFPNIAFVIVSPSSPDITGPPPKNFV